MSKVEQEIAACRQALSHQLFVEEFGKAMTQRLNDHAHIGLFGEWTPTPQELESEMRKIVRDLYVYCRAGERQRTRELTAELSNLAMRFNQLYGT